MKPLTQPINIHMCPKCGSTEFVVVETSKDFYRYKGAHYRRRECVNCKYRFSTYEIHSDDYHKLFPSRRQK